MADMRPLLTVLLCLALSAHVAALASPEQQPAAGAPGVPGAEEAAARTMDRAAGAVGRLGDGLPAVPTPVERAHGRTIQGSQEAQRDAEDRLAEGEARAAAVLQDATDALAQVMDDLLAFAEGTIIRPAENEVARITSTIVVAQEPTEGADATEPLSATAVEQEPFLSVPMLIAGATAAAAAAGAIAVWFAAGSSSAVGGGAKAMGVELRRVLPYASPLFTRFEKDTVMGHPKREELYAAIVDEPGVPLHALCKRTGLSRTAVLHHLRLLEHHHVVVSRRVGRSRHYFENGGRYGKDQKEAYAVLQNDRSRSVAQFIREHPGTIQKRMCDALGLQASIAHWHVRRLQEASLVHPVRQGRTVSYFPTADLQSIA